MAYYRIATRAPSHYRYSPLSSCYPSSHSKLLMCPSRLSGNLGNNDFSYACVKFARRYYPEPGLWTYRGHTCILQKSYVMHTQSVSSVCARSFAENASKHARHFTFVRPFLISNYTNAHLPCRCCSKESQVEHWRRGGHKADCTSVGTETW
jgi:hypothetical protein